MRIDDAVEFHALEGGRRLGHELARLTGGSHQAGFERVEVVERQPDLGQQRQGPGDAFDGGEHENHDIDDLHRRVRAVEMLREDEGGGAEQGVEYGEGNRQSAVEAARGHDLLELGILRCRLQMDLLEVLAAGAVQLDLLEAVQQVTQQPEEPRFGGHRFHQSATAVALAEMVEIDPGGEQHDNHGERQQRQRGDVERRQHQRDQGGHRIGDHAGRGGDDRRFACDGVVDPDGPDAFDAVELAAPDEAGDAGAHALDHALAQHRREVERVDLHADHRDGAEHEQNQVAPVDRHVGRKVRDRIDDRHHEGHRAAAQHDAGHQAPAHLSCFRQQQPDEFHPVPRPCTIGGEARLQRARRFAHDRVGFDSACDVTRGFPGWCR